MEVEVPEKDVVLGVDGKWGDEVWDGVTEWGMGTGRPVCEGASECVFSVG